MTRRITITLILAMALAGCTGSDPVRVEPSDIVLGLSFGPSGDVFETAVIGLVQLRLRPTDPEADASLGPVDLGLLATRVNGLDLNGPNVIQFETARLNAGEYRITRIDWFPLQLINGDPAAPDDMTAQCFEKIEAFPAGAAGLEQFYTADYSEDADPPTFRVVSGTPGMVEVQVDSSFLIFEYVTRFICRDFGSSCPNPIGGSIPGPCLLAFDQFDTFNDAVKESLRFP